MTAAPGTDDDAPRPERAAARVRVAFRTLEQADLVRVHGWLNDPEVARWYSDGAPTLAAVRRKYAPRIGGRAATRVYVAVLDGEDAGLAQTYRVADYPGYAASLGAAPDWAGLDYLIGEPAWRGRGLAHRLVAAFVDGVVAALPGIEICAALPAERNLKSRRALERAGFVHARRLRIAEGRYERLMLRRLADENDGFAS